MGPLRPTLLLSKSESCSRPSRPYNGEGIHERKTGVWQIEPPVHASRAVHIPAGVMPGNTRGDAGHCYGKGRGTDRDNAASNGGRVADIVLQLCSGRAAATAAACRTFHHVPHHLRTRPIVLHHACGSFATAPRTVSCLLKERGRI